jgi:hypothetical protein
MLNLKGKLNGAFFFFKEGRQACLSKSAFGTAPLKEKPMLVSNALLRYAWLEPRLTPGKESFALFESLFSRRRGLEGRGEGGEQNKVYYFVCTRSWSLLRELRDSKPFTL